MELNAHACGSWRGILWSNCHEAMMAAIRRGFLHIELDVSVTADGKFVIGHDAANRKIKDISEREWLEWRMPWNGRRMKLADAFDVLRANPAVDVMWDFRPGVYDDCGSDIKRFARTLMSSRLPKSGIIEVYSWNDYDSLVSTGYDGIVYGLCGRGWVNGIHCTRQQLESDMAECEKRSVRNVSAPEFVVREYPSFIGKMHQSGCKVYSLGWEKKSSVHDAEMLGVDFATVDFAVPGGFCRNLVRKRIERMWSLATRIQRRIKNQIRRLKWRES